MESQAKVECAHGSWRKTDTEKSMEQPVMFVCTSIQLRSGKTPEHERQTIKLLKGGGPAGTSASSCDEHFFGAWLCVLSRVPPLNRMR